MTPDSYPSSDRSRVRRHPERGSHERDAVNAILDEGLVAHVALVVEERPLVLPMAYGRDGDRLLLHGGVSSRLLSGLAAGTPTCVCVTLLDGVVLARSTFHSSFNYRSVVAFGTSRRIEDAAARRAALDVIVEHIAPGRAGEARPPTPGELAATEVVELLIEEASAKTRSGPPNEPEADRAVPVWAGVIPLRLAAGDPVAAPNLDPAHTASSVVVSWTARRAGKS